MRSAAVAMAAACLFALHGPVATGAESIAGESAYGENCQECHRSARRIMRKVPGGAVEDRRQWLDDFLRDHHAPNDPERAAIVDWLLAGE